MLTSTRFTIMAACLGLAVSPGFAKERVIEIKVTKGDSESTKPESKSPFTGNRPAVDVAILLDTSNSMDGLINQAKQQLWGIVQQFAEAKKDGKTPSLRVALFEYGNTKLPASEGYIRQVVQLTDDLDSVSEALFSLKTKGGDEYCGQVIKAAVKRLDWSGEPNSYKAIFIAGNEPFTQGSVDYRKACKKAIGKGIIVNTIHCGSYAAGVSGQWKDGAKLAEGEFLNIDQDKAVVHIDCPQDDIIIRLNAELNKTYLWYGKSETRRRFAENQVAQDSNAVQLSKSALLGRAVVKSGAAYDNSKRDLVDALTKDAKALDRLSDDELPDNLRSLSKSDRLARIQEMTAKRKELQKQIAELNRERAAYLAEKQKQNVEADGATLGDAVIQAVNTQLRAAGFDK